MSAGNDFWACRAGMEYLAAVKKVAQNTEEQNKLLQQQNELIDANNKLLREQIDSILDVVESLKYLR